MKSIHQLAAAACSALALGLCSSAAAQSPGALDLVHRDNEVMAHLNLRALIDSEPFQTAYDVLRKPQTEAVLGFAKGLTGVDLLADIDGAFFFGEIEKQDSIGVVIEGRFDQDKLASLLLLAPRYEVIDVNGRGIHTWFDGRENRQKFGTFFPGMIAVWNSREAMTRSLTTLNDPSQGISRSDIETVFAARGSDSVLRAGIIVRNPDCGAARLGIATSTYDLSVSPEDIVSVLRVAPSDSGLVESWEELLRGGAALMRIQRERPILALLAEGVEVDSEGDAARATLTISMTELLNKLPQ